MSNTNKTLEAINWKRTPLFISATVLRIWYFPKVSMHYKNGCTLRQSISWKFCKLQGCIVSHLKVPNKDPLDLAKKSVTALLRSFVFTQSAYIFIYLLWVCLFWLGTVLDFKMKFEYRHLKWTLLHHLGNPILGMQELLEIATTLAFCFVSQVIKPVIKRHSPRNSLQPPASLEPEETVKSFSKVYIFTPENMLHFRTAYFKPK